MSSAYIPTMSMSLNPAPSAAFSHPKIFIFGLGYVGLALARHLKQIGYSVAGTTFRPKTAVIASSHSIPALSIQQTAPHTLHHFVTHHISQSTHVLYTIPPAPVPPFDFTFSNYSQLLAKSHQLKWLAYLSSTSVYGQQNGQLVSETTSSLNPSSKGKLRLQAEQNWTQLSSKTDAESFIFRLSGIYGPNRNALTTLLRNPNVLSQTSDTLRMLVSRIHLRDIVAAVSSAADLDRPHDLRAEASLNDVHIFNIADDLPATRLEVFKYAEALLHEKGIDPVANQVQVPQLSKRHKERASKRVDNTKMKTFLLPQLEYPTFQKGLNALALNIHNSS